MAIDDVPILKGARQEFPDKEHPPESPGADFIIAEAMKDDNTPLFIALQGCVTDLAAAILKEPRITRRMTAIWIGGGRYPDGKGEFNMLQDVLAAQILFESDMPLWQVPSNVYGGMNITLSEIVTKVKPYGAVGQYLAEEMIAFNTQMGAHTGLGQFPHGETWSIGDQPTVSVLLQNGAVWHIEHAAVNGDMTYKMSETGREIRVYDEIDRRATMEDFFAKLALCYGHSAKGTLPS
jgi:inosine-uridine nucleoside N-ribohydrolase